MIYMSNFACEKCGALCLDSPYGYYSGCEHYPVDVFLLKEFKNVPEGYAPIDYGIEKKELRKYHRIYEWFEIDYNAEPYCVGVKDPGLCDIPYKEIPMGTLFIFGRLK